jgi:hypothetical protein
VKDFSTEPYTFTLIEPDNASAQESPAAVGGATPMPLTAGSELRVSGEVRRVSWDMAEAYTSLEPVEALCSVNRRGLPVDTRPGVVLLDHRFPIWLAIFDNEAFISVDIELADGGARRRFEAASRYVQFLVERGYSRTFDHRLQSFREPGPNGEGILTWLARAGSSRVFDRLRTDRRIGFAAGLIGFLVAEVAMNLSIGSQRPLWHAAVKALVLGSAISALQHYQARKALTERLEQLRTEVLSGTRPPEIMTFLRPLHAIWMESLAVLVFGSFAAIALAVGTWIVGIFLTGIFLVATASLLLRRQLRVELDGLSVEGLSVRGRARLRYADIDRIREYEFPHVTSIASDTHTIWAPASLEHYRQLVDELWRRVDGVGSTSDPAPPLPATPSELSTIEQSLQRGRQQIRFWWETLAAMRPPLWMVVFARNHPLRRQYSWHRHLMERGRVTLGLIVDADPALDQPPRDEDVYDGFAIVLFAPGLPFETAAGVLDEVAARVWRSNGHSAAEDDEVAEQVESFRDQLDEQSAFPLFVEVPVTLTSGHRVWCSSLMLVRRHVPLGYLRSRWIPLLIDAPGCEYVMVVPARYWGRSWRKYWIESP